MRQLVLLCLVAAALCANEVTIDLYMESECPGCMAFVNGELKRALATKDFQKIAKIQVFPYGNAHQSQNADGTWSFTCQHGPTECYGNLLEVCAMSRIQDSYEKLRYVQCIEEHFGGSSVAGFDAAAQTCNPKFNLSTADIKTCMTSGEGNTLQHQVGASTEALQPAHRYVPWIVANGAYNQQHESSIQTDIVSWTCKNYKGVEKIEACSQIVA